MRLLFAFVTAAIAYLCLYPWHYDPSRTYFLLRWDPPVRASDYLDAVANVLLFIPFGVSGMLAWPRQRRLAAPLLCIGGAVFSYSIEWTQRFLPGRFASLRDVACNTLGAIIGVAIGYGMSRWRFWEKGSRSRPLLEAPFAILMTIFWGAAYAYPFIPNLRMARVHAFWRALLHPEFAWVRLVDITLTVVVMYAIYRTVFSGWRRPARVTLLATTTIVAVFLFQAILVELSFSPSRLLAGCLGLMLAHHFSRHIPLRALFIVLLAWLVFRGLWPFHVSLATPAAFTWVPFEGVFSEGQSNYIRNIAAKWVLYAGTIWVARQSGIRPLTSTLLVVVPLAGIEWAQQWIRPHTPEITDVVIGLLAALVIARKS